MKQIFKTSLLSLPILFCMASCDDFLDTLPDNRATLDSEKKIVAMLTSAYPNATSVMMREYCSDNWDSHDWNLGHNNYMDDVWNLKDYPNKSGNDNTFNFWEGSYTSIAASNEVLKAIEKLGNPSSLNAAKAEALVTRAWNHFEMATLFCLPYGKNNGNAMGLPYMTAPEVTVRPDYSRGTVADFYQHIAADLEAGLPQINNSLYIQPKMHFNESAAYAFATKFYMVCGDFDKAIECASKVLGNNPQQCLRDWAITSTINIDGSEQPDLYLNKNNPASLLVSYPISSWSLIGPNNYNSGNKYSHSMLVSKYETLQSIGPWGRENEIHIKVWWNANTNKVFHKKIANYFEYTDPVARIGYFHTGLAHFTTDEVLLFRAEAYILKKQYTKAYEDLNTFIKNYTKKAPEYNDIIKFYRNLNYYHPEEVYEKNEEGQKILTKYPTPKKELAPPLYTIEYGTDQEWLLHYVLHLRRILLMGEGQRWLDINRYGITVHRRLVDKGHHVVKVVDVITPEDKRRAMQIPEEIVNAGCPANPR